MPCSSWCSVGGITGAAAATVLAQGLAVLYIAWFYLSGRSALSITFDALRPRLGLGREIVALGLPIFIIEAARSIVVVVINNILARYADGDAYIALFGVINSVLEFALAPFIGVALAFLPLAAYNYGARNYPRIRQAMWQSCVGATVAGTLMIAVLLPLCGHIIRLFAEANALPSEAADAPARCSARPAHRGRGVLQLRRLSGSGQGVAVGGAHRHPARRVPALLGVHPIRHVGFWGVWWSFPVTDVSAMFLGFVALALVWRRAGKMGEADFNRRIVGVG